MENNYRRVLVFGDLHACFNKFQKLLDRVQPDSAKDFIIFLGDYIDRGEDPVATLDYVMKLKARSENVVALKGNHEWMMELYYGNQGENSLEPTRYKDAWVYGQNGGTGTLSAFERQEALTPGYTAKIRDFVGSLPYTHEMDIAGKKYFFVHAGVEPSLPLNEQKTMDLVWHREEFFENIKPGDYAGLTFVVGHTPVQYLGMTVRRLGGDSAALQQDPRPLNLAGKENVFFMDTGSYLQGGRISCRDFLSGEVWQA